MTDSIGYQLLKTGWVQGTYLFCEQLSAGFYTHCWASTKELSEILESQLTDKRNALILISQACDIAASCDKEKNLEFVFARKLRKQKPFELNLDARSSRFLELQLSDGSWYKAEATKIIQIAKEDFLNQNTPQPQSLTEEQVEVLARWRANRYMRIALPDSFNNKIKPLIDAGLFDTGLEDAGSLYLNLDTFEDSENYIIRLFALHRRNSLTETYDSLSEMMEQIIEKLNDIDGLTCPFLTGEENELFDSILPAMRRSEITIEQLDFFVRWNFDYVSLRANDSEGIDEDV